MQIHELNTLGVTPGGTDYLAIDTGFDTAKISAPDLLKPIKEQADQKINLPRDEHNQPDNGTAGQLLRTNGDGTTDWVDEGLPTDEQTEEAINKWLDDHPEATTTVADGSLTEAKFTDGLKDKTIKDYVTPQMFGAVADANYYNAGAWYKDAGHTQPATDNITAFQNAIDSGYPVIVPKGSYYISDAIEIAYNGATLCGCGSEEDGSVLRCCGTNGIHVSSGFRLITIKNLSLTNDDYSHAAIEVSKGPASNSGSVHYLTIQNILMVDFKYGLCIAGYSVSDSHDSFTYLWNCSFKDLKISTFNTGGDNYSVRIFQNGYTQFGLLFERVTCIGYTTDLYVEAISANFVSCNFGINAVKSIRCEFISNVHFEDCNFECDSKVTSASAGSLILSTFKTVFMCCGFNAWTGSNISFIDGSVSAEFTFIGNRSKNKAGDEMTDFFNISLASRAGSIIFAGGNNEVPRPAPFKPRKLQLLDLERSVLPIKDGEIAIEATDYVGGVRFDATERIGGRPIWYDGISWRGAPGGEWAYLEDVTAGSSKTYTLTQYDDRPRTALVTVRGHQNDAYAFGLLCKYRGNSLATFVPMYNNKCSIAVSGDTITITNTHSSTLYMYISVLDLI